MMQPELIVLLIFVLLLAAVGYYFGFINPPRMLAWLSQASFVTGAFLLAPVLIIVLYLQSGAGGRLLELDIVPHPALNHAIGIAVGIGDEPVWLFESDLAAESILAFYRVPGNRPGWEIESDSRVMLVLTREHRELVVSAVDSWTNAVVSFSLEVGE